MPGYVQRMDIVATYVDRIDRLLTRAHELFAAGDIDQSATIRDRARLDAAALAPIARHPDGMQLLMAVMDVHLAAMRHQLVATRAGGN